MLEVCEGLRRDGRPGVVGIVGGSGSGKTTTASELVRSIEVRGLFPDGIAWLTVNSDAKGRLPSLMLQLARIVHADIGGSVGHAPSDSDDGATYIKEMMTGGWPHGGRRRHAGQQQLKCMVVADNVWEAEAVAKLRETGMWVLLTTRREALVTEADGRAVVIDTLSEEDAMSVLREASELPAGARLPDAAVELIELCGRVAMELAFVGRWSSVRGRKDALAWSGAASAIRRELDLGEAQSVVPELANKDSLEESRVRRRMAVLRAGLRYLGAENDDVQWLYLALAVMPDSHAFSVSDAAVLLYDRDSESVLGEEERAALEKVLGVLERWSILRAAGGVRFRMHDAHSSFARESLMDRGDVRRVALKRWVRHLSSLAMVRSVDEFALSRLWRSVEDVGGQSWRVNRPYDDALLRMMDASPPDIDPTAYREILETMGWFYKLEGDDEGEFFVLRRLLDAQKNALGPDHPLVVETLMNLGGCAKRMDNIDNEEASLWYRRAENTVMNLAVHKQDEISLVNDRAIVRRLQLLAYEMNSSGEVSGAKRLMLRAVEILEDNDQNDGMHGSRTKYDRNRNVGYALQQLGAWLSDASREGEAEPLLRRALEIFEATAEPTCDEVADTLHRLSLCAHKAGRHDDEEPLLRRALGIREVNLEADDVRLGHTLHWLGKRVLRTGRKAEAALLLERSLEIFKAKRAPDSWHVTTTQKLLDECTENGVVEGTE